jgi:hypothetical protein
VHLYEPPFKRDDGHQQQSFLFCRSNAALIERVIGEQG